MRSSPARLILLTIIILNVTIFWASHAVAGAFLLIKQSTEFNKGRGSTVAPGETISLSFFASHYSYASQEYEYGFFLIVPQKEKINPVDWFIIDTSPIYAFLLKTPSKTSNSGPNTNRIELQFSAPDTPGRYKIAYYKLPLFLDTPMGFEEREARAVGTSFRPTRRERDVIVRHAMQIPREFDTAASFTVAKKAEVAVSPPTLYLKVNGETPALRPLKSGVAEKAMVFSWYVGEEFKGLKANLSYRYQLFPDEADWSDWFSSLQIPYFFVPKGNHEFRVQARYQGPEGAILSSIAQFNFFWMSHLLREQARMH